MPWWGFALLMLGWMLVNFVGAELLDGEHKPSAASVPAFTVSTAVLFLGWLVITYAG